MSHHGEANLGFGGQGVTWWRAIVGSGASALVLLAVFFLIPADAPDWATACDIVLALVMCAGGIAIARRWNGTRRLRLIGLSVNVLVIVAYAVMLITYFANPGD